jgi:hypothetical protein
MSPPLIHRIRHRLRQLRGLFPLTWAGILVAAGSAWAMRGLGLGRQDLILLIVGLVGLAVVIWSTLATMLGAGVVAWRGRSVPPMPAMELECGVRRSVPFSLPSLWWLPFVEVDWRWVQPEVTLSLKRRGGRLTEAITPTRRGLAERITRRIEVGDTFWLATITFHHEQPCALRLLPSTGALRSMQVVQGMAGGDALGHPDGDPVGDRIDMRRYGQGDPIRYVLWKVYARSRELMVRTQELALSPTRQTVAYLVIGPADQAAAGAARVAVDSGVLGGDWQLGVDGSDQIADAPPGALDLIVRSGMQPPELGGAGLSRFLSEVGRTGVRRAVVFVPARPGPWLERVKAAAAARGVGEGLEFVVCTDGFQTKRRSLVARALLKPAASESEDHADGEALREVLRALAGTGSVSVVDRAAGKLFPAEQLTGLMR